MFVERSNVWRPLRAAVLAATASGFVLSAHANGMGTPIEPAKKAEVVPTANECDILVTTETAAAITSDLQNEVSAISANATDISEALANAAIATVRKYGIVTPACPCADNTLSFVVATFLQQTAAVGVPEDERNKAVGILRSQLAADMGYPQKCVASAIGEGVANDEATGAINEVVDNGNRGFPGDPPSLLTDRASASGR